MPALGKDCVQVSRLLAASSVRGPRGAQTRSNKGPWFLQGVSQTNNWFARDSERVTGREESRTSSQLTGTLLGVGYRLANWTKGVYGGGRW